MVDQPVLDDTNAIQGRYLGFSSVIRCRLTALKLHSRPLWQDISSFADFFEFEAAVAANTSDENTICIDIGPDSLVDCFRIGSRKMQHTLNKYPSLWDFIVSLGLNRFQLDARLERNQIVEALTLIYSHRKKIRKHLSGRTFRGKLNCLFEVQGLHFACTNIVVRKKTLNISYSYCTLRFSHVVHWFEKKHKSFSDHRALFHAAPRVALITAVIAIFPSMIYAYTCRSWQVLLVSAGAAVVLGSLAYLFFMVTGSIEYDNEEKAYRLKRAYTQLKQYADRIGTDIRRARTVQQKFLPDVDDMPLSDRIDWAFSFVPADEVGGDYFDVCQLDEDRIAILFTDVCGHGMGAAFITAILKTTFQNWVENPESISVLAEQLNSKLYQLTPSDSFAAVFAAIYDINSAEMVFINAGHQPEPWLIPADRGEPLSSLNDARTMIMGVRQEIEVTTSKCRLESGDTILLVSDGIVESQNCDGQLYGIDNFEQFLRTCADCQPQRLVRCIVGEIETFSCGAVQHDDRTILAFQIKTPTSPIS